MACRRLGKPGRQQSVASGHRGLRGGRARLCLHFLDGRLQVRDVAPCPPPASCGTVGRLAASVARSRPPSVMESRLTPGPGQAAHRLHPGPDAAATDAEAPAITAAPRPFVVPGKQQRAFEELVDSADALYGIPDEDPSSLRRTACRVRDIRPARHRKRHAAPARAAARPAVQWPLADGDPSDCQGSWRRRPAQRSRRQSVLRYAPGE